MTLDVMRIRIGTQLTHPAPELGKPNKKKSLKALVEKTGTPEGIGGERSVSINSEEVN